MTGTGPDESSLTLLNFRSKDAIYFFTGSIFDLPLALPLRTDTSKLTWCLPSASTVLHVINFSERGKPFHHRYPLRSGQNSQ